jgi:hypothetical protein
MSKKITINMGNVITVTISAPSGFKLVMETIKKQLTKIQFILNWKNLKKIVSFDNNLINIYVENG